MTLYAKTALSFGTGATVAIFSSTNLAGRMMPVAPSTPSVLSRLISAGARGLSAASSQAREGDGLADIERLGLRLDRSRCTGKVVLIGTVQVVDQRTFAREVA